MQTVKDGDTVRVHYSGRISEGDPFDTSRGSNPFEFTVGDGQVIAGFESAVVGMSIGSSTTVVIPATQAYGEHRAEMVAQIDRDRFPPETTPAIGQRLELGTTKGESLVVTVTDVSATHVTVDGNHPLAGEELTFEIELVDIV